MKLLVVTIVRDGLPWIACHYPELRKLDIPWVWHIIEGTAAPAHCTAWCERIRPGLSTDGTTEYLDSLAFDKRVFIHRSELWDGKVSMVNAALTHQHEPCVILQADADELWTARQMERIFDLLRDDHPLRTKKFNCIYFYCRYFLGPDIVITTRNTFGNRTDFEWMRAWAYVPGMRFTSHEPPKMDGPEPRPMPHKRSLDHGLVFDHMAYATEAQVAFKAQFYGSDNNPLGPLYSDALEGWHRLQLNTQWPAKARDYLRFIQDDAMAARINQ